MKRIRRHLTYANVMSTLAVFAVLAGGGAYAASKIGAGDLKKITKRLGKERELDAQGVRIAGAKCRKNERLLRGGYSVRHLGTQTGFSPFGYDNVSIQSAGASDRPRRYFVLAKLREAAPPRAAIRAVAYCLKR